MHKEILFVSIITFHEGIDKPILGDEI